MATGASTRSGMLGLLWTMGIGLFWTMGTGLVHKVKAESPIPPLPSLGPGSDLCCISVKYNVLIVWVWINGI